MVRPKLQYMHLEVMNGCITMQRSEPPRPIGNYVKRKQSVKPAESLPRPLPKQRNGLHAKFALQLHTPTLSPSSFVH